MATDRDAVARGEARLEELQGEYLGRPGVDRGRMFSADGLRVRGKVFAVIAFSGQLMAKVPAARADELAAEGGAEKVVMRGREMREWVAMPYAAGPTAWRNLLAEAYAYLDEITPR